MHDSAITITTISAEQQAISKGIATSLKYLAGGKAFHIVKAVTEKSNGLQKYRGQKGELARGGDGGHAKAGQGLRDLELQEARAD